MELTSEAIDAYKTIMENPSQYGFSFRPLVDCFVGSDDATPKHILFNEYLAYIQKPLPKVIFYIIMDQLYPQAKAPTGEFGYRIKFKPA